MKVGTLVRIIRSRDYRQLDKLGIVMAKGTWSVDVHIIGSNSNWEPRFAIEDLEVINEGR
jgi:hypothetical protein